MMTLPVAISTTWIIHAPKRAVKCHIDSHIQRWKQTFAIDPLGVDVGVRGLIKRLLIRAGYVFDFEKAGTTMTPLSRILAVCV
jgi:hypothetical protein